MESTERNSEVNTGSEGKLGRKKERVSQASGGDGVSRRREWSPKKERMVKYLKNRGWIYICDGHW